MFGKKVVAVQVAAATAARSAALEVFAGSRLYLAQIAAAMVGRCVDPEPVAGAVAVRCVVQDLVVEAIAGSVAAAASANFAAEARVVDCGSELQAAPE
jgi:hypothetical protein